MRLGPVTAARILQLEIDISASPASAKEWLIQIAVNKRWAISRGEAAEYAERWETGFLQALRSHMNEMREVGRFTRFEFNSSSSYVIQGSAFIEPCDSQDLRAAKARRARFTEYVSALRALNPEEFEALCVGVLHILGVREPRTTPSSADEGIDFYGRIRFADIMKWAGSDAGVLAQLAVWMIGQAKHYRAIKVATPDLRDLVGAVSLAKGKAFGSTADPYEDLVLRPCDPIVYLFFTTGDFSANGWRLMQRSGVVGLDGEMLASFLASNEIGLDGKGFSEAAFKTWITKFR